MTIISIKNNIMEKGNMSRKVNVSKINATKDFKADAPIETSANVIAIQSRFKELYLFSEITDNIIFIVN